MSSHILSPGWILYFNSYFVTPNRPHVRLQSNEDVFGEIFGSYVSFEIFNADYAEWLESSLSKNKQFSNIISEERNRRNIEFAREAGSFALDSIDGVDIIKGIIETISGKDYVAGNDVNRITPGTSTGISAAGPFVIGSITKRLKPALKSLDAVDNITSKISKKVANRLEVIAKTSDEVIDETSSFWNKSTEFGGVKVYQRDDIIDLNFIDGRGRTNLQRMRQGLAPIGSDGNPVNLHHMIQTNDSAIAEVTQSFHQQNKKIIHINPNTIPSGIDRNYFNKWKNITGKIKWMILNKRKEGK